MEKSNQPSRISKLVKGFKGTLTRQKTFDKVRGATPSDHVTTFPPEVENHSSSRDRLPLPLPPVTDAAICQLPYYHPHLTSKEDLTNFMSQYSLQEGYFLLRKSFKDPTQYTITVNHRCGLKHIRIIIMSNGRFSLKDRSFETLDELIQYYSHRQIPNEDDIPGILLRFPIRRPPIEFGEYIMVAQQISPNHPVASPYLLALGKQDSQGGERPQPPAPRPPAALPRGVGGTSSPATSLSELTKPPLSIATPSQDKVFPPPPLRSGSAADAVSSANNPTNDTVSQKSIGQLSTNDPNLSTRDTVSSKPIGPNSITNDAVLSTPIGSPSQHVTPSADSTSPDASSSENERCDCGLLMREAALPLGWSVHVSQDSDTKGQPFFLSQNNETKWDLPLPVALLLSPEQQDLIRNLGFESDIKAASSQISSSLGCSSKTKGWSGATTTKTWVSCDDYESSKSIREALEQSVKSTHGVQSKKSEKLEHNPIGNLKQPKPTEQKKRKS